MSVKITSEIESEIIKLIETKSQKEIAFLYKISKSSVGNIIRKNNIKVYDCPQLIPTV